MEWLQSIPPQLLVLLHATAIIVALPGHTFIEMFEGYMFGFQKGFALALSGKSAGVLSAFAIGRYGLCMGGVQERLKEQLESWPLVKAMAARAERGGAFSVFLLTLAPVPCFVKNYSLAMLTTIPASAYIPAKLLGLLPMTAAHVYAGTLAPSVASIAVGFDFNGSISHVAVGASVCLGLSAISFLSGYFLLSESGDVDEDAERVSESKAVEEDAQGVPVSMQVCER